MNTEAKIFEALKNINTNIGVISTISKDNMPESATIFYVLEETLELYFITRSKTRKYQNIKSNPNVAFVISTINPPKTIQMSGIASEVDYEDGDIKRFEELAKKASEEFTMPPISQMVESGGMVFMKIRPTWIRFGNFEAKNEDNSNFIEIIKNQEKTD